MRVSRKYLFLIAANCPKNKYVWDCKTKFYAYTWITAGMQSEQ